MEHNQPNKTIFLTFDDGPNEPYTSEILDILAAHQAKATFFVCGKNIEKWPSVLKHIAEAGHAIGIHSYSHDLAKTIRGDLLKEIEVTRKLILLYTDISTKLFRPPWGITRPKLKRQLLSLGYFLVPWYIMAFDWRKPAPKFIANHVIQRAFPGAVVLLHDGEGVKEADRSNTVKALPAILQALSSQGYEFSGLSQDYKKAHGNLKSIMIDNISWFLK